MINIIQGIEGDDIPYHASLLGYNTSRVSKSVWFFPLNDHYNMHKKDWVESNTIIARQHDAVIFYDLMNTGDYEHGKFRQFVSECKHHNKYWLTVNQNPNFILDGVKLVPWDFMWNRTRAYYTEPIPNDLYLHHYTSGKYTLPKLDFDRPRSRKYLSLTGRDYGYRTHLYDFIKDYGGYVSNRTKGRYLEDEPIVGAFSPVPNEFYLDSYISIYVESNCLQSDLIHITEKTFDPLLKGHIILPFSNPGTIRRLRQMGFKFPDFVDYSYDTVLDPVARFTALKEVFKNLLMQNLPKLYKDNQEIFIHNQNCINTIPYDNRLLEIFNV
jgi:hypothetical protein